MNSIVECCKAAIDEKFANFEPWQIHRDDGLLCITKHLTKYDYSITKSIASSITLHIELHGNGHLIIFIGPDYINCDIYADNVDDRFKSLLKRV